MRDSAGDELDADEPTRVARAAVGAHALVAQTYGGSPPSEAVERGLVETVVRFMGDPVVYEAVAINQAGTMRALNGRERYPRNPWRRAGLTAEKLEAEVRSRCTDPRWPQFQPGDDPELILELLMHVELDELPSIERVDEVLRWERVEDYVIRLRARVRIRLPGIPRARSSCGGRRRPGRRRTARAHAPPGDSEGEPEPAGGHDRRRLAAAHPAPQRPQPGGNPAAVRRGRHVGHVAHGRA